MSQSIQGKITDWSINPNCGHRLVGLIRFRPKSGIWLPWRLLHNSRSPLFIYDLTAQQYGGYLLFYPIQPSQRPSGCTLFIRGVLNPNESSFELQSLLIQVLKRG